MNFQLTYEQQQLVETFRDFGGRYLTPDNIQRWEWDQGLPDNVCKDFADTYFSSPELDASTTKGGQTMARVLVAEELSRSAGAALPFANDIFNLEIMEEFAGSDRMAPMYDQFRETGRLAFALAISEPKGGSDARAMETAVTTQDGRMVMNGRKTFVVNGEYVESIMVAAIDGDASEGDKPAFSFWVLPYNARGLYIYPLNKIGQRIMPFSDIAINDVEVTPDQRLTSGKRAGFPTLFHLLETGRLMTCAQSLGMAQAAMEDAVAHAKQRYAFGKPIHEFQMISQKLVDMEVKLATMRALVYKAAFDYDRNVPDKRLSVALMKRYVPAAATEVASEALQILGGRGYTDQERVSRIWQDCRGNQIAEGTDEIMVHIAAPMVLQKYSE